MVNQDTSETCTCFSLYIYILLLKVTNMKIIWTKLLKPQYYRYNVMHNEVKCILGMKTISRKFSNFRFFRKHLPDICAYQSINHRRGISAYIIFDWKRNVISSNKTRDCLLEISSSETLDH